MENLITSWLMKEIPSVNWPLYTLAGIGAGWIAWKFTRVIAVTVVSGLTYGIVRVYVI